jgi:multidrug transporter EmrE-like cation transporter
VWAMTLGALITLPFAPGLPSAIAHAPLEASAAVALLALGASAIGFVTWAYALQHIDVSVAAATLYAIPPIAVLVGWAWLGELPGLTTVAGGAVALAGVALVTRSPRAAQAEPADHEQGLLAERAGAGQDPELDGRAVEVEERADAQQPLVAQLAVEDDVDDDEAVRRAVAADRVAVGAQQLCGRGRIAPVRQPVTRALQARVGEGAP